MQARFCRHELRTTDVAAARRFYASILGDTIADIVALPGQARARGARPHWLGQIGVDDLGRTVDAFVERGATRLGPTRVTADHALAIVRDPGGAVVGLTTEDSSPARSDILWHG